MFHWINTHPSCMHSISCSFKKIFLKFIYQIKKNLHNLTKTYLKHTMWWFDIHNQMMITIKLINFSFTKLPFVFFLAWCDEWFWKPYFFRVFPVLCSIIKYSQRACLFLRSLTDSSYTAAALCPLNNLSRFHHPPPPTPAPASPVPASLFYSTCMSLILF